MYSLIGDRFLKRFFGSYLDRQRAKPASQVATLPENEEILASAEKPVEPGCPPREDLLEKEATLENTKTGDINQLDGPENGSDQPENIR